MCTSTISVKLTLTLTEIKSKPGKLFAPTADVMVTGYIHTYRQTDRQTDRRTYRQTDRQLCFTIMTVVSVVKLFFGRLNVK